MISRLREWDGKTVTAITSRRNRFLDFVMTAVTRFGDGWGWLALGFLVLFIDRPHRRAVLLEMGLALSIQMLLHRIFKRTFSRIRPYRRLENVDCPVPPFDEHSFPSGHTATAFAAFAVLGFFYIWAFVPLLFLALLIGVSRIYLGAHYPSDVLAGAVLGTLSAFLAKWVVLLLHS